MFKELGSFSERYHILHLSWFAFFLSHVGGVAQHVKYGVLPEHYPMVGKTLLKTFSSYLKADWTLEVEQAWTDAYGAIAILMLEGAEYPQEILNL